MINPITGRMEPMFTFNQRFVKYLQSVAICTPFFLLVFLIIVTFLNIGGIVDPDTHGGFLHIETFHALSAEGALFDPNGSLALIPTII